MGPWTARSGKGDALLCDWSRRNRPRPCFVRIGIKRAAANLSSYLELRADPEAEKRLEALKQKQDGLTGQG